MVIPAAAVAGVQPQGVQPQGVQPQGVQPQGVQPQGVQPQGVQPQGVQPQGVQPQGVQPQGVQPQGVQPQGVQPQGVALMGTDLLSIDSKGVAIKTVEMRGLTSTSSVVPHALTNIPTMSSGPGNYIAVGGGPALNHYAVAHLADATGALVNPPEDLDLFIADEKKDPNPNQFHRFEEQDNQDEIYAVFFFHKWSGQWMSLCPYDARTKMASAMAIPEDPVGHPNDFIFACTATGVASKCARNWGYRPWAQATAWVFSGGTWSLDTFDLKPYYDICTDAARAGYCQDPKSYTKNGTLVDLFDTRQIIWPNAIENPFNAANPDSLWMMAQEYFISQDPDPHDGTIHASALQRTRYKELSPSAECDDFALIDRLEHDHIEDGRWASPLTNTPRLQVFSPTHCTHDEYTEGDPLPWDCTPCTTQVCKALPECCGAVTGSRWDSACKQKAQDLCKTGSDQWPPGRVWPANVDTSGPPIIAKYLFGPQGAVIGVTGTSGTGSSATVSGWACDPEWPDGTVAVAIYGAPRETVEGALAVVQADQPVASSLAREVSAACDGPGHDYARHGFSFTLPENQSGNVFVYALDQVTDDGPAAPPTLIRNGIVHVPRCAHSEHEVGAALDHDCSVCAGSVCGSDASCCSTSWTAGCAALADSCASGDSSAVANSRVYSAITTGWIEAPSDGVYTFDSSIQPSRLFINGTPVLDWFQTSPGTTQGSITLRAGQKYHLRWDRLQAAPPGSSGPGLTWQPPGAIGQVPIPSGSLYGLAPGGGSGLKARYFDGTTTVDRVVPTPDPFVDINNDVQPPSAVRVDLPATILLPYTGTWEGEVVPSYSEDYTFYVVGSGSSTLKINDVTVSPLAIPANTAPGGCAHDLCELGDKLNASCNSCVAKICDINNDPYCCDGGYLSYYSFDFVWDAKCVAEVNKYCGAGLCSTPPLASPGPPSQKLGPVTLQAGVRYKIEFTHDSDAVDKTVRLFWASARQPKQIVPQFALFPKDRPVEGRGAGLNITYFGTKKVNNVVTPDLSTVVASGFVTDLSLTPTIGQTGLPLVDPIAAVSDTAAATPPPPMVVRPRYDDHVSDTTPQVKVNGIGGLPGGSVRIGLDSDPTVEVIAAVQADGTFSATVPLGATFPATKQTLKLLQRAPGATCVVPTSGACSYEITWPVLVVEASAVTTEAPQIFSPTDPTHSANPLDNKFAVSGQGTSGTVHMVDQGFYPDAPVNFTPAADGSFAGSITLTAGDSGTPLKGWHKLLFDQGGMPGRPVFVSVGIDPPTVEFPRNGAELDCSQDDDEFPPPARGTVPYTVDQLGELQVFEETGRQALGFIGTQSRLIPPVNPGDPIRFEAFYNPGPGKHVLLFFQAPPVPAGENRDDFLRAFSNLADTPTSRVVLNIPPRRFQFAQGSAQVLRPQQPFVIQSSTDCSPPPAQNAPELHCALPFADVNVRVGSRLYTKRANDRGGWRFDIFDVPPHGWNDVTVSQVTDSNVGGAWSESCPSNTLQVGYESLNGTFIDVPADIQVDATSPAGAVVFYDVKARDADGKPVPVSCVPPSGSAFPVGTTFVHCTAPDGPNGELALGGFEVTVVDPPPTLKVFDMVVEADQPAGAEVASYPIIASDVVDQNLFIECLPSVPSFFLLDQVTPVACEVKNRFGGSAAGAFTVQVVDTTAPELCPLSDIKIGSNSGAGAIVDYATCAKDIVDGDITPNCGAHPPGSFFPFGDTLVKCTATDTHGNSASKTFTVSVGDTTPPVLTVPTLVTAIATSKNGAKVSYTVTAVDNIDPHPRVKCTPPSGSQFPLGKTPVTCTATDASGNSSQKTFMVKVIVSWSGLLPPIPADGSGVFKRGSTVPVKFELTGASAQICDLTARLYIAPLDAAGNPGPERPAPSRPPGTGNVFAITGVDYHLNLDTSTMAVGAWQLRVDLGDGEPHPTRMTLR